MYQGAKNSTSAGLSDSKTTLSKLEGMRFSTLEAVATAAKRRGDNRTMLEGFGVEADSIRYTLLCQAQDAGTRTLSLISERRFNSRCTGISKHGETTGVLLSQPFVIYWST